jgi:YidC/Oxa1 family membrane protein insertase
MKALKPYTKKIKDKYTDENMRNRATAKLYEDAQQNPLAGCITSFAQIPIFLGLYRSVTRLAAEGRLDEPFLWIPSLEGPVSAENNYRGMQWLTEGWVNNAPSMGWEATLPFLVMPVVLVLMQSFTMAVLQPPEDESQSEEEKEQLKNTQAILKFLPLMIGFFSLQVPAGLTIYWFTSNLFTVTQSLAIRAYYKSNPPEIELPDYWSALDKDTTEMTSDEKREAAMMGLSTGPSFDQLMDEAKFHYVVKREPLRANSEAWSRVQSATNGSAGDIPEELKSWVGAAPKVEVDETKSEAVEAASVTA